MARVNNGNLLQHAIECAAATKLAASSGKLRLVATHAMAPFEGPRSPDVHDHNRALRDLLGQVACMPPEAGDASPVAVVKAYAAAKARVDHYPNTAELLAALLGRDAIDGVLCEADPDTAAALVAAWEGTALRVQPRPWRDALEGLFPPELLDRPWLFTMDPYTFRHAGERKQEALGPDLDPKDFERLRRCLTAHVKSEQPGALTVFAYGLDASHQKGFRAAALNLADRLGVARAIVGVNGPDETRHLGAVLASDPDLPAETAESWDGVKGTLGLR